MPSVTTYTPYEKLAFFQSVARHGTDAHAFQDISIALSQDEFIHKNNNVERLSAEALQGLYEEIISAEREARTSKVNGGTESGERSPKRRKLSNSTISNNGDSSEQQLVRALADKFYAKYKEEITRDIEKEEEDYARLQDEIQILEREAEDEIKASTQNVPSLAEQDKERIKTTHDKKVDETIAVVPPVLPGLERQPELKPFPQPPTASPRQENVLQHQAGQQPSPAPPSSTPRPAPQRKGSQAPSSTSAHQSPNVFNRTLPPPSPQRPNYGPIQAQPGFSPLPQHQMMPHMPNGQRPSPIRQGSIPSHGSPMPHQGQHPYPPYQQYPPQWIPGPIPGQFQPNPAYGHIPQFYPQPPGRYSQTPQSPYQAYNQIPPIQYGPPQHGWRGHQYQSHPGSAVSTPVSRPGSRIAAPRSESSTPWKRRKDVGLLRPPSPSRPERDVSPLTDKESDTEKTTQRTKKSPGVQKTDKALLQPQKSRRGRPPSKTPSAIVPSRSQSITSHASDETNERIITSRQSLKIKAEPSSTPLHPSDSEQQKSSGRRGRPRNNTTTSHPDLNRTATIKRKRDSPSPTPAQSPVTTSTQNSSATHDPSLVVVSKNFSKTSLLLLNEVTSHKLAGIFAKPLSERDAPGYKDLVLRPQDLKSIKAAISRGSKIALTAIEAIDEADDESVKITANNVLGPIGNGFYLVHKTEDLVPPKAIVNSSQLEMELIRMFANAVMFNPLPTSERGFGRSLRIRRGGGDIDPTSDVDQVSASEQEGSDGDSSRAGGAGWDEGGIIADAREMFEDVVTTVSKWRGLEGERMAASFVTPSTLREATTTGRQGSVSIGSVVGDDDDKEETATPVPSGTARKRRRIAEH